MRNLDDRPASGAALRLTKGERTKLAILDAAEREFAQFGFDAVSMRQIAEASGQLVGVLTYHFPSKEALFEAVVTRRAAELTQLRRGAIEQLEMLTLEGLLDAFLGPFRDRIEHGGPGWRSYAQIMSHVSQESRWAPLVAGLFGESSRNFIRLMRDAEPGLTLETATRGYAHLISVMVGLFADNELLERLSNGRLPTGDLRGAYEPAIRFLAGGLKGMARRV
jgi:AcrR family transcriptional regulator